MLRGSLLASLNRRRLIGAAPRGAGAINISARITVRRADAGCLRPGGV